MAEGYSTLYVMNIRGCLVREQMKVYNPNMKWKLCYTIGVSVSEPEFNGEWEFCWLACSGYA